MQTSLKYAIAKAKRNLTAVKYSRYECIYDAIYRYYIQPDEVDIMMNSVNKWLAKHDYLLYGKPFTECEIEMIKENM